MNIMPENENISLIISGDSIEYARQLRLKGLSYTRIAEIIGISRTTVRRLVQDIKLSNDQKKELLNNRKKQKKYNYKIELNEKNIKINGKLKIIIHNQYIIDDKILHEDIIKLIKNRIKYTQVQSS